MSVETFLVEKISVIFFRQESYVASRKTLEHGLLYCLLTENIRKVYQINKNDLKNIFVNRNHINIVFMIRINEHTLSFNSEE